MKSRLAIAVLCLLVGGLVGSRMTHYAQQRHQQALAVMWLSQLHLDRLTNDARGERCQGFSEERDRLSHLQEELVLAFPLAYRQDADFRKSADKLAAALQDARLSGPGCVSSLTQVKPIRDACDGCHRVYR